MEVGKDFKKTYLKGIEVLRFTPRSIAANCQTSEDWDRLGSTGQIRKSSEGRKELRSYIERIYERSGFILELHDDPANVITHGFVAFPGWNFRLRRTLKRFSHDMKRFGYTIYAPACNPFRRIGYHSAVLEYFPNGTCGRRQLEKEDGLFILKQLVTQLRENYLPRFKRSFDFA